MRENTMRLLGCLLVLGLGFFLGCGTSGPPLTPVTGTVTVDDKPLSEALVRFIPQGDTPGHGGQGITKANGKYEITAHRMDDRKGLLPGFYKVVLTRLRQPDGRPLPPNAKPIESAFVETVPEPYLTSRDTPLTVTIGAESVVFDIPMQSVKK